MSHSVVLEIAFGHCSSRSEGSSLGTEMTYLGAALMVSAPAVPWLPLGTQLRLHRCGTSLLHAEADPEGTQLFCRGRYPTES